MKRRNGTRDHVGRRRPSDLATRFGPIECLESRALLSISPHARIVNGDVVDGSQPSIVNGTPTSGFSAVGAVGDRSGPYCTGTLISARYVLTAGHCAEGLRPTQGRFTVGDTTYSTSQVFVHPGYNGNRIGVSDAANDLAIFQLSVSVAGITPDPIFRATPHLGDLLTLVGLGAGGSGTTGHDNSFGIKRAGTTPIDGLTPRRVLWNFDNNSESNTAPGDSGGPAYLAVGGVYYVAGVTSGGDRPDAGIGDHSYDTRVDYYAPWIDSIIGTISDPGPSPDPAPRSDDHANSPGSDATPLPVGSGGTMIGSGSLEIAGDRDVFQVQVSATGSLSFDLGAADGTLDAYVRVYDAAGNLITSDDDSGPGTDSHFSVLVQPGVYYISAGAYNDRSTGAYVLNGTFSLDDYGDTFAGAMRIPLSFAGDGFVSGTIGQAGDRDVFQFVPGRTGHLSIDLQAGASGLDPVLTIYDHRGRVVAVNDDGEGTVDSHLLIRVKAGSTYYVQAAGFQASQGDFTLELSPAVVSRHGVRARSALSAPVITRQLTPADAAKAIDRQSLLDSDEPSPSAETHCETEQAGVPQFASPSMTDGAHWTTVETFDALLADTLFDSL